jgi:hypothetical protein
MKYRKLRISWSAGWGVVALLLTVLWVRSYTTFYGFFLPVTDEFGFSADSVLGHVLVHTAVIQPPSKVVPFYWKHFVIEGRFKSRFNRDVLGFYVGRHSHGVRFDAPHWFLVLSAAGLSAAPWLREKLNFSLRALLIATALVAVGLGLVVYAVRS